MLFMSDDPIWWQLFELVCYMSVGCGELATIIIGEEPTL